MDCIQSVQLFYALLILVSVLVLMLYTHKSLAFTLLWVVTAIASFVLGLFPGLLLALCRLLQISSPMLFAMASALLVLTANLCCAFADLSCARKEIRELYNELSRLSNIVRKTYPDAGEDPAPNPPARTRSRGGLHPGR